MSYLIILTFGPVQTYISQSRRTQDLLQGSRILSHLADEVVKYVTDNHANTTEVIYPIRQADLPDEIAGTPNRIVVRVEDNQAQATTIAKGMQNTLTATWENLSDTVLTHFINREQSRVKVSEIWTRQRDRWLELYWIVREETGNYDADINASSEDLASRKMLRNFQQIEEKGLKCSITGEHEALYDGKSYADFWKAIKDYQPNLSMFGQHERLSAIATIKRIAHECYPALKIDNRFPSTSSIASITFKYDVLKAIASEQDTSTLEEAVTTYVNALLKLFKNEKDLLIKHPEYFGLLENQIPANILSHDIVKKFRRIDGDFLYDDTLIASTVKEYSNQDSNPAELLRAKDALKKLVATASKHKIAPPQPYYVILSMDGDKMGELLKTIDNPQSHKTFSDTLSKYAKDHVIRLVQDENLGRVVYAGGDDILALLPIREALTVANDLRLAFANAINIPATASTGLAFVHHTHNLQQAISEANDAQKYGAKNSQDRNALAVRLLRRSGEARYMQHDWELINHVHLSTTITDLVSNFANDGLGRSLPYDLGNVQYAMGSSFMPSEAIEAELSRVVKRRLPSDKQDLAPAITNRLLALASNNELPNRSVQLHHMMRWVELARFITQSTTQEESV